MEGPIKTADLETIDIKPFEIVSNPYDIHRDLHVFARYMRENSVKRFVRSNNIPKADIERIAKMLSVPAEQDQIEKSKTLPWLDFIDKLALRLDIVHYDTAGVFLGPTSVEPSYPDNYIRFDHQVFTNYISQSCQKQEQALFDKLVGDYSYRNNEFVTGSVFSRLDRFPSFGFGTGVMPSLRFDKIRRFMFDCLQSCESGRWYGVAPLVGLLKKKHPYFLIPENPEYKHKWEREEGRYGNFREGDSSQNVRKTISENVPDAFERVEGRFVERFLEHVPLLMGYVELAYGDQSATGVPSMGCVRGFRVRGRFPKFMDRQIPEPSVKTLPGHEIRVKSVVWPVSVIEKLAPFTRQSHDGGTHIFMLDEEKARQYADRDESPDAVQIVEALSPSPLPENIAAEWADYSKKERLPDRPPPDREAEKPVSAPALKDKEITIERKTSVTLSFESRIQLDIVAEAFLRQNCPIETDTMKKRLTFHSIHQEKADAAVEDLKTQYRIRLFDTRS